ncbi:MAG TPA: hypothetical protein VK508_07505 [Cyclobacteriaceae bacterium]|nr:hypothetical protein [Cyclobacteriaceae bacterium]
MSYKPDESILISWLYGELDEAEKAKVEKYFQENPDELKKMKRFGDVRNIMGNIGDKEVIAPPLFMDDDKKVVSFWKTNSFRTITAIAASFLLILVAARLLNTQVSYSNGELRISFGKPATIPVHDATTPGLTAMQVQQMIDESERKSQETLETRLAENATELDAAVRHSLASNTAQINELVKQASTASQTDIRTFVATLQRDNLAQMRDFLQLSASDQRKYTDNIIIEFSKFLTEQRTQDINMFQTRFSRIEQNTDELKNETEQILASIISNTPQVQQSSY